MNWPPVKAWTKKVGIDGHVHFVAVSYGGELLNRWVILMSVLDSNVVVKVLWCHLVDLSKWESGWDKRNYLEPSKLVNHEIELKTTESAYPSVDSGLTIPITGNKIRPWFDLHK